MSEELTLEEQVEKMRAALDRYKKENQKFREERDALQSQLDEGVASDEVLNRYKRRIAAAEAKVLLNAEGIKDADRLVKRLNLDSITLDENDELQGLGDQVKELKSDFPELFDTKRRVGGGADASTRGALPERTPTEVAVSKIFNR